MKLVKIFYKGQDGFTLIELMAVVGIMGILAGVLIPQLTGMQNRARDTGIISAAGSIRTAMSIYYTENNHYPIHETDIDESNVWNELKSELTTIDLGEKADYNIRDITYEDNSEAQQKYLIVFTSASDDQLKYYLGEKTFSEKREEASSL